MFDPLQNKKNKTTIVRQEPIEIPKQINEEKILQQLEMLEDILCTQLNKKDENNKSF